jgi:hypothetical protein
MPPGLFGRSSDAAGTADSRGIARTPSASTVSTSGRSTAVARDGAARVTGATATGAAGRPADATHFAGAARMRSLTGFRRPGTAP